MKTAATASADQGVFSNIEQIMVWFVKCLICSLLYIFPRGHTTLNIPREYEASTINIDAVCCMLGILPLFYIEPYDYASHDTPKTKIDNLYDQC